MRHSATKIRNGEDSEKDDAGNSAAQYQGTEGVSCGSLLMPCTLHHHNGCSSLGACITTKSVPAPPPPLLPGFAGWGGAALASNHNCRPSPCPSRIQPLNTKALSRKLLQLAENSLAPCITTTAVPALYRASPQRLYGAVQQQRWRPARARASPGGWSSVRGKTSTHWTPRPELWRWPLSLASRKKSLRAGQGRMPISRKSATAASRRSPTVSAPSTDRMRRSACSVRPVLMDAAKETRASRSSPGRDASRPEAHARRRA